MIEEMMNQMRRKMRRIILMKKLYVSAIRARPLIWGSSKENIKDGEGGQFRCMMERTLKSLSLG